MKSFVHAVWPPGKGGQWRGDDFPAWLSPMVVKELRQGVQSGAFAWTFIGLQAAMFLLISWGLTFYDPDRHGYGQDFFHFFFWLIVAIGVLFVVPLRGLAAISSERVGNNLDLVRLTRLSATRIVVGKWLAIMAQAALLVTAILPYLVLRYFFGGINVIRDLEIVAWLFAGSMVVGAAALALSTQPLWVRIGTGVLAVPVTIAMLENVRMRLLTIDAASRLGALALLLLYTVALLEYTASRIAPLAENHALRKRLLGLLIGGVWLATAAWARPGSAAVTMVVTLPLLVTYAIEALLEQPVHLRSQAATFVRGGLPGRLAAHVLTPGWATGLVFTLLLAALCLPAWWCSAGTAATVALGPVLVAAVLFPLPAVVYLSRVRHRLLLYALVHLLCLMAFVYTNAMKPRGVLWQDWPIGWMSMLPMPMAALASLVVSGGSEGVAAASLVASGVIVALVSLAVLPAWLREIRETRLSIAAARVGRTARAAAGAMA